MDNKQLIDTISKINLHNKRYPLTVTIPVQESSLGQRAHTLVSSVTVGMDWDTGLMFINPEQPLQYANRHELYQRDVDWLADYKKDSNLYNHYKQSHDRQVKKVQGLMSQTNLGKLTTQQLKDMENILKFNNKN